MPVEPLGQQPLKHLRSAVRTAFLADVMDAGNSRRGHPVSPLSYPVVIDAVVPAFVPVVGVPVRPQAFPAIMPGAPYPALEPGHLQYRGKVLRRLRIMLGPGD